MAEQPGLGFGGLLQRLRAEAGLTQEELAQAAGLSPRSVSDLERGIHRTARQDTARLLADALGLAGTVRALFAATARDRGPADDALAAVTGSPYRGLAAFEEQDAALFFGREAATVEVLDRMSRLLAGVGLLVVSGASGAGPPPMCWRPGKGWRRGRSRRRPPGRCRGISPRSPAARPSWRS